MTRRTSAAARSAPARAASARSTGQTVGADGEAAAVEHLHDAGLRIEARNWRPGGGDVRGELDVVAWEGRTLVFVEVKARRGTGDPLESITPRKQQRLRRLAAAYLHETAARPDEVRFDAVAVTWRDGTTVVRHLRGVGS